MARSVVPHLLLQFGGFLGAAVGIEIWSCALKLTPLSTGESVTSDLATAGGRVAAMAASASMQTLLNAPCMTAVKTLHPLLCDSKASLTWVKLNAVGSNGLQVNPVTLQNTFAPIPGTRATVGGPFSAALGIEHRNTTRSRGFATHGRISYPAAINVDGATGRVVALGVDAWATSVAAYGAFLAKLNLQLGADASYAYYPSISYGTDSTRTYKVGGVARAPVAAKIDSFYLSTIPAHIRSRQNNLVRGQAVTAVAYGAVNT